MDRAIHTFVGRNRELEALRTALSGASAGTGSLWFVTGEPGVGKSRLLEEFARTAPDAAFLWGSAWEAGGAPAFWPWVQILRALFRRHAERSDALLSHPGAPFLADLLPELRRGRPDLPRPPRLEASQARFALFDTVANVIWEAAAYEPLVLVLEDLHAADPASVQLLDFLARQVRGSRVMLLGTYRDTDARRAPAWSALASSAREAHTVALGRLTRADVSALAESVLGALPDPALVDELFRVTEGNSLFLLEVARRLVSTGELSSLGGREPLVVPTSVESAIEERLSDLAPDVRGVLEAAAVMGRDVEEGLLGELSPGGDAALLEGMDRGILVRVAGDQVRFSHILIREALYGAMEPGLRRALHLKLADVLESLSSASGSRWSEVAHHLMAAGPEAASRAVRAAIRAAEDGMYRLAFDDALLWWTRAHERVSRDAGAWTGAERAEVLLGLARALLRDGQVEAGRARCLEVIDLADQLGDADLAGWASLEYGTVLFIGEVDDHLVGLLERALAALEPGDSTLRARLTARFAAALQPADDPQVPIDLALEAIAMARRIGDEGTLVSTIEDAMGALMDLNAPAERSVINREHRDLTERLDDPAGLLRASIRLAYDGFELADRALVEQSIAAAEQAAARLGRPHYRWPVLAARAVQALLEGELAEAARLREETRALLAEAGDKRGVRPLLFHELYQATIEGDMERIADVEGKLYRDCVSSRFGEYTLNIMASARALYVDAPVTQQPLAHEKIFSVQILRFDMSLLGFATEAAVATGDTVLAARLFDELAPHEERVASAGQFGQSVHFPVARYLGLLAHLLGRDEQADRYYTVAMRKARALRAGPHQAWIGFEHGRLLATSDPARAHKLLAQADEVARRLELGRLVRRVAEARESVGAEPGPTPDAAPPRGVPELAFDMVREGDVWCFRTGGSEFRLRHTKGMGLLSTLVAEPGREFHVLDLASPTGVRPKRDTGDAGPALDEQAKRELRARVTALRSTIEEAESWNDTERAARAREELGFIEAEIAAAVGLGGRDRPARSDAERARINVQRRLRDALKKIRAEHEDLGRHLEWAIRTGSFCSYTPW